MTWDWRDKPTNPMSALRAVYQKKTDGILLTP